MAALLGALIELGLVLLSVGALGWVVIVGVRRLHGRLLRRYELGQLPRPVSSRLRRLGPPANSLAGWQQQMLMDVAGSRQPTRGGGALLPSSACWHAGSQAYALLSENGDLVQQQLRDELATLTASHGWRAPAPLEVVIRADRAALDHDELILASVDFSTPTVALSNDPDPHAMNDTARDAQLSLQARDGSLTVLSEDLLVIGRGAQAHLNLEDPAVSRLHAEVVRTPAGWWVRDCGSRHGTFLNGDRLTSDSVPLTPGCQLSFAGVPFQVVGAKYPVSSTRAGRPR